MIYDHAMILHMTLRQKLTLAWVKIKKLPKKYTISIVVLIAIALLYSIVYLIPRPVAFSYASAPCVNKIILFPDLYKSSGDTGYEARPSQLIKLGSFTIASRSLCFLPTAAPQEGTGQVNISPFGGWLMRRTYAITATAPPTVDAAIFRQPVPSSQPLRVPLSDTDRLSRYILRANDKQVDCSPIDLAVECDMVKLGLSQGKKYKVEMVRQFGDQVIDVVAKEQLVILPATRVADSSIKPGEMVYSKPKAIDITFDKKLTNASYTLYQLGEQGRSSVKTDSSLKDDKLQVKFAEDLPRSTKFELVIDSVQAVDKSGLEKSYVIPFETSGGPRVAAINVGSTGIPMGATATLTFDQALLKNQDLGKSIKVTGGATIAGGSGMQLFISLAAVPKCGDFTITITNDLQSEHQVSGNSTWQFSGRMVCHTIATIGYSRQGRPINAYYFGSGPASIVYTGAIHGSELSTQRLMYQWIDYLETNARRIPASRTIVIVPQINPDGIAAGARVNAHNVDLNRNFATSDWQKDITDIYNQPFPGGGGEAPMSEPETQAIAGLVQQLRPELVLSYHSIGGLVLANGVGVSPAKTATYSQLSGYYNATGQSSPFEYGISGTADTWYAERVGVASIVIELGSHSYSQFSRNVDAMWAMLQ